MGDKTSELAQHEHSGDDVRRARYERPVLRRLGSVNRLTLGGGSVTRTDGAQPTSKSTG